MTQLEIEFFWPLTEQIPLDLEYPPFPTKSGFYISPGREYCISAGGGTGATGSITIGGLTTIDVSQGFYFKYVDEPPWYRKIILKIIGISWRK